ncbi:adenylyltransferase/cytidyltransferase family protein [Candidatus Dojkabacteria bacterium]|nr:adenylyltransferase/cytidyltransferase family protein [Candidatus Dojkabacteria bacterium]
MNQLENLRRLYNKKKLVLVCGTFDILHPGHIKFLSRAKKFGDLLVVGISPNKRVTERKGAGRPIVDENDRAIVMDNIKCVDFAIIMPYGIKDGLYPTTQIISLLKPNLFYTTDTKWLDHRDIIEGYGTTMIYKREDHRKSKSTSRIIEVVLKKHK